ncbi:hypothetical protein F3Y22_tig00016212pilonHSYRG00032 [Hibiscus syriacus]|uniref:Uncharacterized protein n=1 Tax=Hibiscus syriacus TaxID=106335 RepID=A0A6A3BX47_HIBSY|nr:hypothetical protein F3Y22_tig00016212pilonHSYRG00032 [Hibiscus syriacus]
MVKQHGWSVGSRQVWVVAAISGAQHDASCWWPTSMGGEWAALVELVQGWQQLKRSGSFPVKFSFELDILRREVEIHHFEFNILHLKLKLTLNETGKPLRYEDVADGHDILRCEVEIMDGPFVVKWSLELDILHREVKIQSKDVFDGHDILRREVEIVDGPFVMKLSLKLDILRREVEIQSKDVADGHDILCREVEIVDNPFVVKLNFELDILFREVEIQSKDIADRHDILCREVKIMDGPFIVKLSLDMDILHREVEIQKLFLSLISFIVKLKSNIE